MSHKVISTANSIRFPYAYVFCFCFLASLATQFAIEFFVFNSGNNKFKVKLQMQNQKRIKMNANFTTYQVIEEVNINKNRCASCVGRWNALCSCFLRPVFREFIEIDLHRSTPPPPRML